MRKSLLSPLLFFSALAVQHVTFFAACQLATYCAYNNDGDFCESRYHHHQDQGERGQEGEGTQLGDQERKEVNDVLGRRKQRRSTTLISSFLSPKVPSSLLTLLCTLFTREDEDYRISRQRREPTSA